MPTTTLFSSHLLGEWGFRIPTAIQFGSEAYDAISRQVGDRRALLVSTEGFGKRGGQAKLAAALGPRLVGSVTGVTSNPDVEGIVKLCHQSRAFDFQVVVAIGGGSVLDAAKVLAAGRDRWAEDAALLRAFLASGGKVQHNGSPVITVPTTSGTGAEVTPFATVWDNQLRKKFSVDGAALFPEAAIVDPRLTIGLPEDQTIATGLDAVSQALESIWNKRANPITTTIATQSLVHSLGALPRLVSNLQDDDARYPMALGSLLAGVAISQTRTGIAHSISYPLTMHYGLVHGIACSFALAPILRYNLAQDDGRFADLSRNLGIAKESLPGRIQILLKQCGVLNRVRDKITSVKDVLALQSEMITPGRADNNFCSIDTESVRLILLDACNG